MRLMENHKQLKPNIPTDINIEFSNFMSYCWMLMAQVNSVLAHFNSQDYYSEFNLFFNNKMKLKKTRNDLYRSIEKARGIS